MHFRRIVINMRMTSTFGVLRRGTGVLLATLVFGATTVSPSTAAPKLAWRTLSPAPTPRTEAAAAVLNGEIYLMGGYAPPAESVPVVEIYNPEQDSWRPGPPLVLPVNHAAAATLDDTIYILGGYLGYALGSSFALLAAPTDGAFALRGGTWQPIAPLPAPRAAGGAAVVNGKIYVAGGVLEDGSNATTTLIYDPRRDAWSETRGLRLPRQHLGVAATAGSVFAVGGRLDLLDSNTWEAERLSPPARRWTSLSPMPTARGGLGLAATAGGLLVAVGGEGPGSTFEEVEAYSIARERWFSLPDLPTPRHGLGVVAIGDVVYAIAGGTEPSYSYSSVNEALDLSALRF